MDDAWQDEPLHLPMLDAREWGPRLRFSAPPRMVENFYRVCDSRLPPFLLYGSGDFHYLSGLWLRRVARSIVLISFDNHPDWDIRPPKWGCGGWINRALDLAQVKRAAVWGCGNFECWWPHNIFGNHAAERAGKLEVHPWADDRPVKDRQRPGAILREDWRELFEAFVARLGRADLYVTIDLDCLRADEISTNWENGRFDVADLEWALARLRERNRIVAGDVCGAFSPPNYARWKQRFAAEWDHPKLAPPNLEQARRTNFSTLERIWPALTGL